MFVQRAVRGVAQPTLSPDRTAIGATLLGVVPRAALIKEIMKAEAGGGAGPQPVKASAITDELRGRMIELRLDDSSAGEDDTLFAGGAPLWL